MAGCIHCIKLILACSPVFLILLFPVSDASKKSSHGGSKFRIDESPEKKPGLSSTVIFKYPSVESLVDFLIGHVLSSTFQTNGSRYCQKKEDIENKILAEVEMLSEKELEAFIEKEFTTLNGPKGHK